MVGLIPLFAVETLDSELIDQLPRFKHRMQWFIENRPDFSLHIETAIARRRGAPLSVARQSRPTRPRCCATCWMKTNSSRPTA